MESKLDLSTEKETITFENRYDLASWFIIVGYKRGVAYDQLEQYFDETEIGFIKALVEFHAKLVEYAISENEAFEALKEKLTR